MAKTTKIVDGKTALVRYMAIEQEVRLANGKVYYFRDRGGVCLAWVDNADVPAVLDIKKKCCGGKTRSIFQLPTQAQIEYWESLK